jgi:hypothetical protein
MGMERGRRGWKKVAVKIKLPAFAKTSAIISWGPSNSLLASD